jgi:RNA polymerase sigma factor (sigma-70 family)
MSSAKREAMMMEAKMSINLLTDEILTDLVKQKGERADEAMACLVERHTGFVKSYAGRSNGLDFDDALARGFEGLWNAAMKYDSSEDASFLTYARQWVFRNTRNRGNISDAPLAQYSDENFIDTTNAFSDSMSWSVKHDIDQALQKLDKDLRDLINKRFYLSMTIEEIADEMNCPKATVSYKIRKGCEKLAFKLKGYDDE